MKEENREIVRCLREMADKVEESDVEVEAFAVIGYGPTVSRFTKGTSRIIGCVEIVKAEMIDDVNSVARSCGETS